MGKRDISINAWLKDKRRFADLFNGLVFDGEQVVKKEELVLMPTDTKMVLEHRDGVEKYRDVVMLWKGVTLAFLALENQDKINYQMPLRTMLYDALSYKEQANEMWNNLSEEEKKAVSPAEFVSQYRACDKLTPVITLVLYYGDKEEWNGPAHLYDMLELPDELKNFVPDYKINLVELEKIDNKKFVTDLQVMFGMLKYRKDKKSLARYIEKHREYFAKVDDATFDAGLSLLSFSGALAKKLEKLWESGQEEQLKEITEKKGEHDMCKAIEDMINDGVEAGKEIGRQEGEIIGAISAYKELDVPKENAVKRVIVKFKLTEDEAWDYVEKYWI
ncbi:MAG: Rpn family recombination-promoting nuclease/putative transposase [Lachnospira sp.]|nr:Rpn family recombination-promoting nuclease/putative transposase [Lachnospira sp.]